MSGVLNNSIARNEKADPHHPELKKTHVNPMVTNSICLLEIYLTINNIPITNDRITNINEKDP